MFYAEISVAEVGVSGPSTQTLNIYESVDMTTFTTEHARAVQRSGHVSILQVGGGVTLIYASALWVAAFCWIRRSARWRAEEHRYRGCNRPELVIDVVILFRIVSLRWPNLRGISCWLV